MYYNNKNNGSIENNTEYLRNKLLDYVGTAAFNGMPAASGDVLEIQSADYDKLLDYLYNNIDQYTDLEVFNHDVNKS